MEGKVGLLTAAERDDLSKFLLNITFPPAQRRAYTNELSDKAKAGFDQVWDMVLEGSSGFSGSFARQVTLNQDTAEAYLTHDLLDALESSSSEGGIVLQGGGVLIDKAHTTPARLQSDPSFRNRIGAYVATKDSSNSFTRDELVTLASEGNFVGTFTGHHGANADFDHPQPALWTLGSLHDQSGQQEFPILFGENKSMTISVRHIRDGAHVIVHGSKVSGTIRTGDDEMVVIDLESLPTVGMHILQVQNQGGLFSNEFI